MTNQTQTDRLAEVVFHAIYGPDANAFDNEGGCEFASGIARAVEQSLSTNLANAEAENARLRAALAAKPWPPADAELREMLAVIVGAWWSPSTAQTIRTARQLKPEDIKGMYAVRDALAPYVARAALNPGTESE